SSETNLNDVAQRGCAMGSWAVRTVTADLEGSSHGTAEPSDSEGRLSALSTSVGKALALLDALGSGAASLGVSELARRADLPKSTAFRLLACLEDAGYVDRIGTEYCLGRRLFELGNQIVYCQPSGLRDA